MIDIQWLTNLLPESIDIQVWNKRYKTDKVYEAWDLKYVLKEQIDEDIETDIVFIYANDWLLDTIEKRIKLKAWDILHLEYTLYVREDE